MEIKVLEHERKRSGFLRHVALVEVEGYEGESRKLAEEVSAKVGYHPLGYGIYGAVKVEHIEDNTYRVKWSTGTTAD